VIKSVKNKFISTFEQLLRHYDTQLELFERINKIKQNVPINENMVAPYFKHDIEESGSISERDDIVFITSRFRTGSTMLWNLFRNMNDCTAYYEPFNERRWFDKAFRGAGVDQTHLGVNDYWTEYDGLAELGAFYQEDWIREDLHMDEKSWDPNMKNYIDLLVGKSKQRPILQFNRIDFRLGWIKKNYPNAKLLHLYRNPRDQWCSFLTDKVKMNKDDVITSYEDNFYLDIWCNDLAKFFPFLSPNKTKHPYQRFYYLWKLSYLYGRHYADLSMAYEDFCNNPKQHLTEMNKVLNWKSLEEEQLLTLIKSPNQDTWKKYADEGWFYELECHCEKVLTDFFK